MDFICCCVCGKIRKNNKWVDMWLVDHHHQLVSHGWCPKHLKESENKIQKEKENENQPLFVSLLVYFCRVLAIFECQKSYM